MQKYMKLLKVCFLFHESREKKKRVNHVVDRDDDDDKDSNSGNITSTVLPSY